MNARCLSFPSFLALLLAAGLAGGCGPSDTVGQTFQDLSGAGGNSTGGYAGQGGTSTGGAAGTSAGATGGTTTSMTNPTTGGMAGSSGSGGTGGTGGGPTCDDTGFEPNDSESSAKDLGTISDCDGDGSQFSGVLSGPNDIDWYKYSGQDTFGCSVGPSRGVMFMMPARLCKYVQCEDGSDPTVTCPGGTTNDTSPDGRKGCCGADGFDIGIDCTSVDDNATIYIRVDKPSADCVPYTVTYHY